ncbi:hypothetical protein SeLEV6574_g04899 [Synchytrium endobioticum]|uniref:PDZ GRASP-type domain-containing protein n=1 Tax=Synchytrium endobioticum TaxID=286115 RepID=A0A507CX50_9FUNG|nr:hypothetical protein SeLEV6574_g04899 [Synchytrium endobioticum]
MGGGQSSISGSTRGYHVLKVVPGGPGDIAGLEPYFDYIVAINGELLDEENSLLITALTQSVDKEVLVHVFSAKYQDLREVVLTPSRSWGKPEDGLIGCSVRFCDHAGSGENVWHILDVHPDSPAEKAGLKPHSDYIIGSPQATLREQQDLYDLIERSVAQPLQLFVYNKDVDSVREVLLVPNDDWGGPGFLGCDIGYGYIHKIPTIQRGPFAARPVSGSAPTTASADPISSISEATDDTRKASPQQPSQSSPLSRAKSLISQPDYNTQRVSMGGFENVDLVPTSEGHQPQQNRSPQQSSGALPLSAPTFALNAMSIQDPESSSDDSSSDLPPPPPPPPGGFIKAHAPNLRMGSGLRYGGEAVKGIEESLGIQSTDSGYDVHSDHSHANEYPRSGHEHDHDHAQGDRDHGHSH